MQTKVLITFFCLIGAILVTAESEPEPEGGSDSYEFIETKNGVSGTAYKHDDTTIHIKNFYYRGK